ncbi:glycine zipper domain-containing protein [Roseisolibacter sp. H3M3-2]|uniref:glycine zipper domain-containing protein n=1 Tax=Roseisolibacter sp. H3M3-2 TaxID=3031323 RepID=UPI0023D989B8|nr:glycine zipper domain-containing protein [Roseisolibacter sp. H3M3-2]MDF1502884.1 glycine zipper domain-containing protein [Roseisolibacter sp. H3M3-2]
MRSTTRTIKTSMILAPALALAAACGREQPAVDDALRNDLSLATQAQRYPQNQFVNPAELGYGQTPYGAYNPYAPQGQVPQGYYPGYYPAAATAPAPVRERVVYRTRTASTARSGGSGTYSSGGTYDAGAAERKRQRAKGRTNGAIIGSVAGAAIGVATSGKSDRLKGGLIGAVAGAGLGAVIGNNQGKLPF